MDAKECIKSRRSVRRFTDRVITHEEFEQLIDLAKIGLGIAFVPDYCLSPDDKDIYIIRTKEKMPARQIVVSVNTTLPVSASTEEFLKLLPTVN